MRRFLPLLHLIIGVFALLALTRPALAAGEFSAAYDVSYAISPAGVTIVTQEVALTNLTTNLYPQRYTLILDSTNVKNVIAYDEGGIITPAISQNDGKTDVLLSFNRQVVGLGKVLTFSLRYEHGDIAHKNGSIWEVNVPGITPDPDLSRYDVAVSVPPSFGPNAYLTPAPANGRKWTKEQMMSGGISGAWGDAQQFDLTLRYHLTNTAVTPQEQTITLPPDTAYQKVHITGITPAPRDVQIDKDGNWIASYILSAGASVDIDARVRIRTFLFPQDTWLGQTIDEATYLSPTKYWQVGDAKIQEIAKTVRTPRDVYNYVVSTLSYDYERINQNPQRKGARATLEKPGNSLCTEFTDLFVAVARAAGIPAREVIGYAYTTNAKLRPLSLVADVLHAWPEYFDRERGVWVAVDPTWADTTGGVNYFDKLDFNHIAFAIHGSDSETPYPAGFFRKAGSSGKDVEVGFAEAALTEPQADFEVIFDIPELITAGRPTRGRVIVRNTSGVAAQNIVATLTAAPYGIHMTQEFPQLPPLGAGEIALTLPATQILDNKTAQFTVLVNGKTFRHETRIRPFYWILVPAALVLLGLMAFILWFTRRKLWKQPPQS
jgi:transglutaminase-like putative cysteine protease